MLQNRLQASPQPAPPQPSQNPQTARGGAVFGKVNLLIYLVLLLFIYEKYVPEEYKLSAVLGRFEGNIESHSMNAKLEATRAMVAAQEQEKAKAELEKQLALVREQNSLELQKQQQLLKAQNDLELQKQMLLMRQKVVSDAAETQVGIATLGQLFAAFAGAHGKQELANTVSLGSEALRAQAMQELDQEMQRGLDYMTAGNGQPAVVAAGRTTTGARPSTIQQASTGGQPVSQQGGGQNSWQQRDKEAVAQLVPKVTMARVYKSLKQHLNDEQFAAVKKGNGAWIQARNRDCQAKEKDSDAVKCLAVYTNRYRDALLDTHHQLIGPFLVPRQS
ncbi:MAG: hypothetical protein H7834_14940 [Magnetococcus sp. YQC-9]